MNRTEQRLPRVLVADDEKVIRQLLCTLLSKAGLEPLEAGDGTTALEVIRKGSVDAVLLDIDIPAVDGIEVLREAENLSAGMPVIVMSGSATREAALEAMKAGAFAYVTKPFGHDELLLIIRRALEGSPFSRGVGSWVEDALHVPEEIGRSGPMCKVFAGVERVAPSDFTVVISGETGSGKELVAKAIHRLSPRAAGPFIPVDCGSIPATLVENELFGHEKGSFTGADRMQPGKFEAASGGTLFLDEVSNLPLPVQRKLLRALQAKRIWRVGGTKPIEVDIRVIAATNQDLVSLLQAKRFRRDLYYRLNEFSIVVPPLRERPEDIAFLAQWFLTQANRELGKDVSGISEAVWAALFNYEWLGNIRELRNVIRRAALLADTEIEPEHLGILGVPRGHDSQHLTSDTQFDGSVSLKEMVRGAVRKVEREALVQVLRQTGGNKAKAARILQIDYKTIHNKVKQYGISV